MCIRDSASIMQLMREYLPSNSLSENIYPTVRPIAIISKEINETLRIVKTSEYMAYFFALGKFFRPFEFMLCVQIVIKVQETV